MVVRDLTVDANWPGLLELDPPPPTDSAVLSVSIYSFGNATVGNVRSINTYGDKVSENECFSIFLSHPNVLDEHDVPPVRSMLAVRNCIAEEGHGDYVVGMTAFSKHMVDMRGNVCRNLPNGIPPTGDDPGSNPSAAYQFTGRGITFTDNKSYNCPAPLYFDTGNIYDVIIANNEFFGCGWAGLLTYPTRNFFGINVRQGGDALDGKYVDLPVTPTPGGPGDYRSRVWLKKQGSTATPPAVPSPGHRARRQRSGAPRSLCQSGSRAHRRGVFLGTDDFGLRGSLRSFFFGTLMPASVGPHQTPLTAASSRP